jgi:hypothetical protein
MVPHDRVLCYCLTLSSDAPQGGMALPPKFPFDALEYTVQELVYPLLYTSTWSLYLNVKPFGIAILCCEISVSISGGLS